MSATAALISDTSQIDSTLKEFVVDGTVTLSGNYTANGDTLDFSQLGIPSNSVPNKVEIYEATPAPGPASGYTFVYEPGTTQAYGLMAVFGAGSVGAQFSGAYGTPPFAKTGFALKFRAWFPSFI